MNAKCSYRIENSMDSLMGFCGRFHQSSGYGNLDFSTRYVLDLALEEMASNIIKYGYDDARTHQIDIGLEFGDKEVLLELCDDGHPFNPLTDAVETDVTLELEERPMGGVGIMLTRNMAKAMRYRREGKYNILSILVGDKEK